jgi:hypothetical protein
VNRRDLLRLLGFTSVALVLPTAVDLHTPLAGGEPANAPPAPLGNEWVTHFTAEGIGPASRPGWAELRRVNAGLPLLRYGINEYGGALRWHPRAGDEIFVPPFSPVWVATSGPGVIAGACLRRANGRSYILDHEGARYELEA